MASKKTKASESSKSRARAATPTHKAKSAGGKSAGNGKKNLKAAASAATAEAVRKSPAKAARNASSVAKKRVAPKTVAAKTTKVVEKLVKGATKSKAAGSKTLGGDKAAIKKDLLKSMVSKKESPKQTVANSITSSPSSEQPKVDTRRAASVSKEAAADHGTPAKAPAAKTPEKNAEPVTQKKTQVSPASVVATQSVSVEVVTATMVVEKVVATKPAVAKADVKAVAPKQSHRTGFKASEFIVYPAHGVGQIVAIEEQEVAGFKLELFVISFAKDKMTLKVPLPKVLLGAIRKLSEPEAVKKSLDILMGRARIKRTMWSRRAQEYEAKINSGDLGAIAEVVRDLFRSEAQPEQSYSERQLYEAALDRMAREIAAVQRVTETEALKLIEGNLLKGPKRGAKADTADAADGDIEQAA